MSTFTMHSSASRAGEAALWTAAAIIVLAAHLAAAGILMQERHADDAMAGEPPAIMLELALAPEAQATEETIAASDMVDAQEVKTEQLEPVQEPQDPPDTPPLPELPPPEEMAEIKPEPVPPEPVIEQQEPMEEPEPVAEMTQTIPEPVPEPTPEPVEKELPVLDTVEVPLPVFRPPSPVIEKAEIQEIKKKPVAQRPKPQPQRSASVAKTQAMAETQVSDRTAATRTSSEPAGSVADIKNWDRKIRSLIARRARSIRFTCPANFQGRLVTSSITFNVLRSGEFTGVSLSRSSGVPDFDLRALEIVKGVGRGPAPVENMVRTIPIEMPGC
ncbi:energy transducer TonB [Rhizobium sp. FY34]|uniref:energy transducer TonB family protein n=1 Tax=Rhizobium sp. FY34 TaxID=2562309 RepID=UPI0010C0BF90|nr:energy transducer TonB [Rhizobium sp. FY34]